MSALGQKQTFRSVSMMSALPPKADIVECDRHVRLVPEADKLRRKLVFIRSWPGDPGKRGYQGCPELSNCRRPSDRD